MISFLNRRHINGSKIDEAIRDILNQYNQFTLPKLWGGWKIEKTELEDDKVVKPRKRFPYFIIFLFNFHSRT